MKIINLYSLIAATLVLFTACDDFLDTTPISAVASNGYYTNDAEIETAVLGIYDAMQSYDEDLDYEHRDFALTEMRSDNTKSSNSEGIYADFERMNVDPTNVDVTNYWSIQYNVIMECNTVLNYTDRVVDEGLKKQFEGEAKFGRALSHFNMVRAFGEVPVINILIKPEESNGELRKPVADVYASIVSDLMDAVSLLPKRDAVGEGRATEGAARTLLAKVYLTLGNYTDAKSQLDAVMALGDYSLLPSYNDVFYSELNAEIIFAIQYLNDDSRDSQDFSYEFTNLGSKSGLNFPTDDFIAAVDPADTRFTTLFTQTATDEWECGKFIANSANTQLGGNDWVVLRYADVLLMYVEAVLNGGDSTSDTKAVDAFKEVRGRAGFDVSGITSVSKQQLLDERRIELAFENHRLYDLVRFGVADEVLDAFSKTEEANFEYDSWRLLLPVPQREANLNPDLSQNPGY